MTFLNLQYLEQIRSNEEKLGMNDIQQEILTRCDHHM